MNLFKKYINYLKDNPEGYWFMRKIFGWGCTPARWQGWAVVVVVMAFIVWQTVCLESLGVEPTEDQLLVFFAKVVASIVVLIAISYKKGEKPKCQWGFPEDK